MNKRIFFIISITILKKQQTIFFSCLLFLCWFGSLAQNKLDDLKQELALATIDSSQIAIKIKISRELHKQPDHANKDIEFATEAVNQAISLPYTLVYARALNNLGLLYRYHQQYALAVPLHVKAFQAIKDFEGHSLDKMIFANNAGVAGRYVANYELAVTYYMKALQIAEKENSLLNIEIACNGLGNTYMSIPNREEEGLNYLKRALKVAKKANNRLGLAMNYLTISGYFDKLEQHDTARIYLRELLALNKELKDDYGMAMTFKAFGESYLIENKNLELAEFYFNKALSIFETLKNKQRQAITLYNLGEVAFKKEDYNLSLNRLNSALKISEDMDDKPLIVKISEIISTIYEKKLNYHQALTYYKQARDFKDSINLDFQEIQIATISRQFDLEKKEAEIDLLKKEQSFQKIEIKNHQTALKNRGAIIVLLVAFFITLAIIAFQQHRNRKNIKATTAIINQREREKVEEVYKRNLLEAEILANQMKLNPHFLFNCLNSIKYLIQQNDSTNAIKYLVKFSRFTRMVLETANKPTHSVNEELELIAYYLELEKNRFNSNFTYSILNSINHELNTVYIPALLLQPFVENAIWHGLLPSKKETKCVSLTIKKVNDAVEIHIDDNGLGRQEKKHVLGVKHKSRGTEINNKRIALFNSNYDSTIQYKIIDKKGDKGEALGTTVILSIKQHLK